MKFSDLKTLFFTFMVIIYFYTGCKLLVVYTRHESREHHYPRVLLAGHNYTSLLNGSTDVNAVRKEESNTSLDVSIRVDEYSAHYVTYEHGINNDSILLRNTRLLGALAKDTIDYDAPIYIDQLNNPCFSVYPSKDQISFANRGLLVARGAVSNKLLQDNRVKRLKYLYSKNGGDQPNFSGLPMLSSPYLRCLPGVYLAGFTKCGTTEVHAHLIKHQHVIGAVFKEPRFWDENRPIKTQKRNVTFITHNHETMAHIIEHCYLRHNPDTCSGYFSSKGWDRDINIDLDTLGRDLQQRAGDGEKCPLVSVDASSTYISNGHLWESDPHNAGQTQPLYLAPHRLHHIQPQAKTIIMVRNPVDRLFSDYNFFASGKGHSIKDFHNLVTTGIEWWHACVTTLSEYRCAYGETFSGTNITDLPSGTFSWKYKQEQHMKGNGAARLRIGVYVIYIQQWLKLFARENILVIRLEDYSTDNLGVLEREIYPFMALEPPDSRARKAIRDLAKKGGLNKSKSARYNMLRETRILLERFYEPYNRRLAQLLQDNKYLWL